MGASIRQQSRLPPAQRPTSPKPPMPFEEAEEREKQIPKTPRLAAAPDESGTIQDRIMDLMEQRQKSADMDKYLALAQAGFTLMQPTEGGFGEALGKAGVAGIQAYQDASDRYQTGLSDVLDTEIALQKAAAATDTDIEDLGELTKLLTEIRKGQELGTDYGLDVKTIVTAIQDRITALSGGSSPTVNLGSLAA